MKTGKNILKAALLLTVLLTVPKNTFAFHKSWCNYYCYCGKACNCGYTQSTTPIDGGLSLLLVAGVAYGGKRYSKLRKEQKENK